MEIASARIAKRNIVSCARMLAAVAAALPLTINTLGARKIFKARIAVFVKARTDIDEALPRPRRARGGERPPRPCGATRYAHARARRVPAQREARLPSNRDRPTNS